MFSRSGFVQKIIKYHSVPEKESHFIFIEFTRYEVLIAKKLLLVNYLQTVITPVEVSYIQCRGWEASR